MKCKSRRSFRRLSGITLGGSMSARKFAVWIAVGLVGLAGCAKRRDASMAVSESAAEERMAGAAAPSPMVEAKPGDTGKGDSKPAPDKATWKRSQIVPNSSRVMVGDRE